MTKLEEQKYMAFINSYIVVQSDLQHLANSLDTDGLLTEACRKDMVLINTYLQVRKEQVENYFKRLKNPETIQ